MAIFELGKSNAFGNNQNVSKGNYGTNFWGHKIFKFDGSINDKKNLLQSVKTFVRLLSGKNIPVRFASDLNEDAVDSSYTDGKTITISSKIDKNSLDSSIGLALHETSHVVKTNFKVIKDLINKEGVPTRFHDYVNFIKSLHNWIEDRRIDNWAFNKKPGYKIYYLELYDRYFYCKEIEEVLIKDKDVLKLETGRNYEFFIFNSLHPKIKMNELKGLPEIKNIIDINDVARWKSTEDTLQVAYDIMDVILKYLPEDEKEKIDNINFPAGGGNEISDELSSGMSDLLKKLLQMQEAYSEGHPTDIEGGSIKIKINISTDNLVEALDKADTKLEDIKDDENGDYSVVTVNHIDEASIKSGLYEIFNIEKNSLQESIINDGFKFGTMLGRKLQIRNDERTLKTVRLKSGKIDKRMLHSAGQGNYDIFQSVKFDRYNDIAVHISIDMSGSMCGKKWDTTLLSLVAIAKATSMVKGIRTQISLRYGGNLLSSSNSFANGYHDEAIVINFYDSEYDNIKKMNLLAYAEPDGSTPEGACFEALAKKIMAPLLNKNTLFINFSDGAPGMHSISNTRGVSITKNVIKKFRGMGMNVLSYFIEENKKSSWANMYSSNVKNSFIEMYGKEASFIDVNNMFEVAKTINKNFLKMGKD